MRVCYSILNPGQSVSCIMFAACLQGYLVLRLDWSHFIHDMPAHPKLDVSRRHTGCFDLICCSFVHPIILGITVQHHTNEKPKTCILTVTANNGMCFCTAMLEHLEQIFGHQKCQLPWRGWPFLCSIGQCSHHGQIKPFLHYCNWRSRSQRNGAQRIICCLKYAAYLHKRMAALTHILLPRGPTEPLHDSKVQSRGAMRAW